MHMPFFFSYRSLLLKSLNELFRSTGFHSEMRLETRVFHLSSLITPHVFLYL